MPAHIEPEWYIIWVDAWLHIPKKNSRWSFSYHCTHLLHLQRCFSVVPAAKCNTLSCLKFPHEDHNLSISASIFAWHNCIGPDYRCPHVQGTACSGCGLFFWDTRKTKSPLSKISVLYTLRETCSQRTSWLHLTLPLRIMMFWLNLSMMARYGISVVCLCNESANSA